jgi:hypothetical protein
MSRRVGRPSSSCSTGSRIRDVLPSGARLEVLGRGLIFSVLVDGRRQQARRYELLDLPCFRP